MGTVKIRTRCRRSWCLYLPPCCLLYTVLVATTVDEGLCGAYSLNGAGSVCFPKGWFTERMASLAPSKEQKRKVPSDAASWPRIVSGCGEGDEMRYCPPLGCLLCRSGKEGGGGGGIKTIDFPDSTRGDCDYPGRAPAPSPVPTTASTPLLEMCTVPAAACIPCIFASVFLLTSLLGR